MLKFVRNVYFMQYQIKYLIMNLGHYNKCVIHRYMLKAYQTRLSWVSCMCVLAAI